MRKCGSCTLCCTLVAVPTIDKPRGVECKHLTKTGCGVYNFPLKPDECSKFWCLWLHGDLPNYLSPIITNVVAWSSTDNDLRLCEEPDHKGNAEVFFKPWILGCIFTGYQVHVFTGKEYRGCYANQRNSKC